MRRYERSEGNKFVFKWSWVSSILELSDQLPDDVAIVDAEDDLGI